MPNLILGIKNKMYVLLNPDNHYYLIEEYRVFKDILLLFCIRY